MSIDYSIYIGPFLKCRYHFVDARVGTEWVCEKCGNKMNQPVSFCSLCGGSMIAKNKIGKRESVSYRQRVDAYAGSEDLFTRLHSDSAIPEHWLGVNQRNVIGRQVSFDPHTGGLIFESADREAEMRTLSEVYRAVIERLAKIYDWVEVAWGVVVTES